MSKSKWSDAELSSALSNISRFGSVAAAARAAGIPARTLQDAFHRLPTPTGERIAVRPKPAPVSLNRELTRILIVSDAHHPFVDKTAWGVTLNAVEVYDPHVVVIIGDFVDCYSISEYPKDPARLTNLRAELDAASEALDALSGRLNSATGYYLEGNHEERLPRCLNRYVPGLEGLVTVPQALNLAERGFQWVPYGSWIKLGKVAFAHDIGHAGVHAARQTLLSFGGNIVFGHTHRGGVVYDGTVDGERHVCMNVGWLGDLSKIDYGSKPQQIRTWQHGFGIVDMTAEGHGWCTFVPIVNGACVVHGKRVTA